MAACLAYFGFVRQGCVCPVGSVQNVTHALANAGVVLPVTVLVFFLLPVVLALFFGRVFCGSVCPLGAIQDVVVLKPLRLPRSLSRVMSLLPIVVLALVVLFAAMGARYVLCQYDPFVGFFRLQRLTAISIAGAILLIVGLWIARPFCRFLCPYGVVLGWLSGLSRKPVSICPGECINCGLCVNACPFDAIESPPAREGARARQHNVSRLRWGVLLVPLWMVLGGWCLSSLYVPLSRRHHRVQLAETLIMETDPNAGIEKRQFAEAFRQYIVMKFYMRKYHATRLETDGCTGFLRFTRRR